MRYHEPVLLKESIDYLNVFEGGKYVDCTLGDGGHAVEILKRGGRVLGIDLDEDSILRSKQRVGVLGFGEFFTPVRGNFACVDEVARDAGFGQVNGVLYDLGFSSYQLEAGGLGLSFRSDEPLDMRLDKNLSVTAADLVNALSEAQLSKLFFEFGEERYARRFAKAIVNVRGLKKLATTRDLSDLIVGTAPPGYEKGRIHPATRVFQALRMAVNDELGDFSKSLPRAASLLTRSLPGGRMLVISFNSLEDRVAKDFGREARLKEVVKGVVRPKSEEVMRNPRARSAKMRVYEV
ncbi:16S rRNA (cytosine(1402)-N(4))-methyltransferase RsmH [candidate division WWE3 bacterium]|nr:16S rRNA (cytosine(1402)-N(4))-methyltransferase RsmH [candidate division WWE3 bacterium]